MSHQLPLALRLQHAPCLDDFIVGNNQALLDALARTLDGAGEQLIFIAGAAGSGRSHLLLGQCAAAEARGRHSAYLPLGEHATLAPQMLDGLEALDLVAVDDVDAIAGDMAWERALFSLFNRCRDSRTTMLFSAAAGPALLPLQLADLRSRLAWGLSFAVQPLDDGGRLALLTALAQRCALQLPDDVARYLLERGPRHPSALVAAMELLDRASLAEKRRLTIPFVRSQLEL
ncbi:MAG: DnaA regulatory inactivator Hda [Gammaproteobacteria bacterium]|nr:DnaA regulatory inactivator Hda [Gammaproteobacteria bacterium]